jgi:hypothetical protein
MNFQWKIQQITGWPQQGVFQDVMTVIRWSYEAVDGAYFAAQNGATALPPPSPEDFVPFAELTESKCIEYVQKQLQDDFVGSMESELRQQIEKQKQAAPVVLPLPWNQS